MRLCSSKAQGEKSLVVISPTEKFPQQLKSRLVISISQITKNKFYNWNTEFSNKM